STIRPRPAALVPTAVNASAIVSLDEDRIHVDEQTSDEEPRRERGTAREGSVQQGRQRRGEHDRMSRFRPARPSLEAAQVGTTGNLAIAGQRRANVRRHPVPVRYPPLEVAHPQPHIYPTRLLPGLGLVIDRREEKAEQTRAHSKRTPQRRDRPAVVPE